MRLTKNGFLRGIALVAIGYLFAAIIVFLCSSCHRRSLYHENVTPVKVIVSMDWRNLGGNPTGATIYFYPEGKSGYYAFKTNSTGAAEVSVPSGYYTVLVYYLSEDEYYSMSFENKEQLGTVAAVLQHHYWSSVGSADSVGYTVYEPELILAGRTDHFQVREKTTGTVSEYSETATRGVLDEADTCYVTPQHMVYTGTIKIRVNGIEKVHALQTSFLTGMAGADYLATRRATNSVATHVITSWKPEPDATDITKGYLTLTFSCFGLPEQYKTAKNIFNNRFHIKLLLWDEETVVSRSWDVGDRIEEDDDKLRVDLTIGVNANPEDTPIDVPDVKPKKGTSTGFDVSIEDWKEGDDVFVPL